jgi:hypothetical protein
LGDFLGRLHFRDERYVGHENRGLIDLPENRWRKVGAAWNSLSIMVKVERFPSLAL